MSRNCAAGPVNTKEVLVTFETSTLHCPACGRGEMRAEVNKGNVLFLACINEKCEARIKADGVVGLRAEEDVTGKPVDVPLNARVARG